MALYIKLEVMLHILCFLFLSNTANAYYHVEIQSSGSAVVGSTVNFTAILYNDKRVAENGDYQFTWKSSPHSMKFVTQTPYSNWSVKYPQNSSSPGVYTITLLVETKFTFLWVYATEGQIDCELTESLGGQIELSQNNIVRPHEFVAINQPVLHTIALRASDREYLFQQATSVQTYWFQNCTYLGMFNGIVYEANYPIEDTYYDIEALVVATFDKLPEPTTTMAPITTTEPITTTTVPALVATPSTINVSTTNLPITIKTESSKNASNLVGSHDVKRSRRDSGLSSNKALRKTAQATVALLGGNQTIEITTQDETRHGELSSQIVVHPALLESDSVYDCVNKTVVARDPKKLYGYFKHRVVSKIPVANFTAIGKNWLQHGDLLKLQVQCRGSPKLEYCYRIYDAPYNSTGNETCKSYEHINQCGFDFMRFFAESKTILFFIRNDVSAITNQVTINFYEAIKQSQLSVVVVPITFTLVAVILVVFGISYYVQSGNRFTVEVADFNFAETQSVDMEYKTFQQRLYDSISESLPTRWWHIHSPSPSDLSTEPGNLGGAIDSNLRYNIID